MASTDFRADYRDRGSNVSSQEQGYNTVQSLQGHNITHPILVDCPSHDAEPRKEIMSVELAIKRELAYQRKMATLRLQTPVGSGKAPMPAQTLQLQTPVGSGKAPMPAQTLRLQTPVGSGQAPMPAQTLWLQTPIGAGNAPMPAQTMRLKTPVGFGKAPMPAQCPSPSVVGMKRKAPSSNLQCLPPRQHHPSRPFEKRPVNLICKVCQVSCSGAVSFKQHREGSKHKAKLKILESQKREEKAWKPCWCEICKVPCVNELSFEQHLIGKKHMAHVQGTIMDGQIMKEDEVEAAKIKWEDLEWEVV